MPAFILVGDGHPATATLKHLLSKDAAPAAVFATAGQENRGALTRLCGDAQIPLVDSSVLKDPAGTLPLEAAVDWILNINSTVLLPDRVLRIPRAGALNMHPGLLPEYAGLHTHQWAIRNGESVFGVTVHEMVPSVDAGDIIHRRTFEISDSETGLSLYLKCMEHGLEAFRQVIDLILSDAPLERHPQDLSRRTLYRHGDALDGDLDWTLSASAVERFVRAGTYTPLSSPSYTPTVRTGSGRTLQVLEVGVARVDPDDLNVPGHVLSASGGGGPRVICGGGTAVSLNRATIDGEVLQGLEIEAVVKPGERLP